MKLVLCTLNSKYIHSSLALWYLKQSCEINGIRADVSEFTINDSMERILSGIYEKKPDILGFSCYIWNIAMILQLCDQIKEILPNIIIILGGPEVSYDAKEIMANNESIDFIIKGEGEEVLPALVDNILQNNKQCSLSGLCMRTDGKIIDNEGFNLVKNLNSIPSPYTDEMLKLLSNRIVYMETSRGCPYNCSYCISSTFNGVRYFDLERAKQEIKILISSGIRQIKFVDRTFNAHKKRAIELFEFIASLDTEINFHFEVAAHLFDVEMFEILNGMPAGRIQFEIGIQTTNSCTLLEIDRKTSMSAAFQNVKKLMEMEKFNIHLDLIAGLPYENYYTFANSFDDVYSLRPHQLHLGFLKLLKGSKIRREADIHGYKFIKIPPYEVLKNNYINYDSLRNLKDVEEVLERYYNSGSFKKSLDYLLAFFITPFDFYEKLALFCKAYGYLARSLSMRENYRVLMDFAKQCITDIDIKRLNDLMKYDFLTRDNTGNIPSFIERVRHDNFKNLCHGLLKSEEFMSRYLPHLSKMKPKEIFNKVHFEYLNSEPFNGLYLFDYTIKDPVNGRFRALKIMD